MSLFLMKGWFKENRFNQEKNAFWSNRSELKKEAPD